MSRRVRVIAAVVLAIPLVAVGWLFQRYRPKASREDPVAIEREIASLTMVRDSMRTSMFATVERSDLLARIPAGDVLIGIPTPFLNALVREVIVGWFHDVDLRLRGIRVRKAGEDRKSVV